MGDNESRWCARVALPSSARGGLVVDVSLDDDLLIILRSEIFASEDLQR